MVVLFGYGVFINPAFHKVLNQNHRFIRFRTFAHISIRSVTKLNYRYIDGLLNLVRTFLVQILATNYSFKKKLFLPYTSLSETFLYDALSLQNYKASLGYIQFLNIKVLNYSLEERFLLVNHLQH